MSPATGPSRWPSPAPRPRRRDLDPAGDIACAPPATRTSSSCHHRDTSNLLVAGDNEYGSATCSTPGASGYVSYFGDAASPNQPGCRSACPGYYSYDLGSWHVVVLNTNCSQPGVGGCGSTSPQGPSGAADPANGVRQFIVGTGGKSLHGLSRNPDPQVESR